MAPSIPSELPPELVPAGLYDPATLLGGWRADDPLSYAATLDARTYRRAVADSLRVAADEGVARARALHDHVVTRALGDLVVGRAVVAFMGGHRLERGAPAYRVVARSARALAAQGFLVLTGGGPGAMEAAHLGARTAGEAEGVLDEALDVLASVPELPAYTGVELVESDGTFDEAVLRALHRWQAPAFAVARQLPPQGVLRSVGVPTWLYGHEPPTPLADAHAKYFDNSIREDGLLAVAKAGVVFAEGGAGTLQEVFQDAAQNFYGTVDGVRSPMVFVDIDEYWSVQRPVKLLLEGLFDDEGESRLFFVDTATEVVEALTRSAPVPSPDVVGIRPR